MDGLLPSLAALHVVAAEQHIGRAAGRLGVRQPSLSAMLDRLEARVGQPLVERRRGAVRLTPLGQDVHPKLTSLLTGYAALFGSGVRIRRGEPDDRHLAAVVAVADLASVAAAAARLGVSPSATSERVAVVERQLGRALFERRHGMRPLPRREDELRAVRALHAGYADAVTHLVDRRHLLAIGFLTASDPPVAEQVVETYRSTAARVRLVRVFSDERLRLLRDGLVDAAFVRVPPELYPDLTGVQVDVDELVAALPEDADLDDGPVALADVNARGLHWYAEGQNDWFEERLADAVARAGAELYIVGRSVGPFPNLTEVARGNGATLISRSLSKRLTLDGVGYRELAESLPLVVLSLVHRRGDDARPEVATLLRIAREHARPRR